MEKNVSGKNMINDTITITSNDPILRDHKAFGAAIMPGLAYVDLVYQVLNDSDIHFSEWEIRKLTIHRPMHVDHGESISVDISVTGEDDTEKRTLIINEANSDSENDRCFIVAEIHKSDNNAFLQAKLPTCDKVTRRIDLDEIYRKCREQNLVHSGIMKAVGDAGLYDSQIVVNLEVDKGYLSGSEDFLFHPALIDGAANAAGVLAFELIGSDAENKLFLPLYYETFKASKVINSKVTVVIPRASIRHNRELLSWDMDFFCEGEKVAELKRLTIKLVRDAQAINPTYQSVDQLEHGERTMTKTHVEVKTAKSDAKQDARLVVKNILSKKLGIPSTEIDDQAGYYEMGLNSPMLLEVVVELEKTLNIPFAPTLLFEFTNVDELSNHIASFMPSHESSPIHEQVQSEAEDIVGSLVSEAEKPRDAKFQKPAEFSDVAIIGVSGKYPNAENIEEFWNNLKEGTDCITQIPENRWDWRKLGEFKSGSGRPISHWGGFIPKADYFDPQFFKISPKEAKALDPQERLFLQVCWEAIEDSGYTPKSICQSNESSEREVGVFAGVMHKDHMMVGAEAVLKGENVPVALNNAAIANRVSYVCNFHGPSMVVDTACSSSMTAIHLAVQSIRNGESKIALAGGVNLSFHPNKYLTYGSADMLSTEGHCKSFGEGGDGYVPGEGVGVIVLKPLRDAIADGDNIYAVIKGSAINHGGKVSGITVPSPVAQQNVIKKCYVNSGIDPNSVSYVEAHGTGTSLGDPIEIQGLSRAYKNFTDKAGFCAIGSVKSNIGHAEAAAGISAVTKVLLQLYHKTLVASLHSEKVNPNINLSETPFYIQNKTEPWVCKTFELGNSMVEEPRRAAISSFGATGTNVHIVLEEFDVDRLQSDKADSNNVVVLSARSSHELLAYVEKMYVYLNAQLASRTNKFSGIQNLAYTLQVGREAMAHRLALVCSNLEDCVSTLASILNDEKKPSNAWIGEISNAGGSSLTGLFAEDDTRTIVSNWIAQGRLDKVAALWVAGVNIEWGSYYSSHGGLGAKPLRMRLPTYPFALKQYSINQLFRQSTNAEAQAVKPDYSSAIEKSDNETLAQPLTTAPVALKNLAVKGAGKGEGTGPVAINLKTLTGQPNDQASNSIIKPLIALSEKDHVANIELTNSSAKGPVSLCEYGQGVYYIKVDAENNTLGDNALVSNLSICMQSIREISDAKVLVLISEGQGFFGSEKNIDNSDKEKFFTSELLMQTVSLNIPVVAVVKGKCSGLNWLFASLCDFMVCSDTGSYSYKIDESWICQQQEREFLNYRFGRKCVEMLISGKSVSAKSLAKYIGITVAPEKNLNESAFEFSTQIAVAPKQSIELLKEHLSIDVRKLLTQLRVELLPASESNNIGELSSVENYDDSIISKVYQQSPKKRVLKIKDKVIHATELVSLSLTPTNVAILRLHDKEGKNTFDESFTNDIKTVFELVNQTESIKALVVTGYDQYFSLGGSKDGLLAIHEGTASYSDAPLYELPLNCRVPVIAAMQGHSIGAGWSLGNFCDAQVLSKESTYSTRFMGYGFTPGFGSTLVFPIKVSRDLAWEALFSAKDYSGKALLERGISVPVVARSKVLSTAIHIAETIVAIDESDLETLKKQSRNYIKARLGNTVELEKAMHGKTFVCNNEALQRIKNNFVAQAQPLAESKRAQIESVGVMKADERQISLDAILTFAKTSLAKELDLEVSGITHEMSFIDMGLDSISGVSWINTINNEFGLTIAATKIYSHPNLAEFVAYISDELSMIKGGSMPVSTGNAETISLPEPVTSEVKYIPQVVDHLRKSLALELDLEENEVSDTTSFIDLGLDSISGVTWIKKINDTFGLNIEATKVYSYPNLEEFSTYIGDLVGAGELEEYDADIQENVKLNQAVDVVTHSIDGLEEHLRTSLAKELGLEVHEIELNTPFIDMGLDSISGVTWIRNINDHYQISLEATTVYTYPTILEFAGYMRSLLSVHETSVTASSKPEPATSAIALADPENSYANSLSKSDKLSSNSVSKEINKKHDSPVDTMDSDALDVASRASKSAIAVIGMAGRFPKSPDLESFWENIENARDCVTEVPAERWDVDEFYSADIQEPGKTNCRWMGALDNVDMFDPLFFNISPMEAELMDPQQRLFLETAWQCIEDAGLSPKALSGTKCGVFAGGAVGDYASLVGEDRLTLAGLMGDTSSVLAARISYLLDLQGPCLTIDTACSSSLVAIASACESLYNGTSDLALAGGAYVMTTPEMHIMASKAGMLSDDGRCFTFDQRANGFVPGEGVGVIMLKRLQDAERDGDNIQAVIKGWGINQDGKTNGITAPNPKSQTRLESEVYKRFSINPEQVQLVEAHGTGTKLGDPIEIEGLVDSFKPFTSKRAYCALGSVKSNIGHALTAAGVAGTVKLLLSLKHKKLPATANFRELNEHISLDDTPFYISTKTKNWEVRKGEKRCSAISSFGFSGTNAHLVIEEYSEEERSQSFSSLNDNVVVTLSARDAKSLKEYATNLQKYITDREISLVDLAYTLHIGRQEMDTRLAIVVPSVASLSKALGDFVNNHYSDAVFTNIAHVVTERDNVEQHGESPFAMAATWVNGATVDWSELHRGSKPRKISLPTYPFARKRYWVDNVKKGRVSTEKSRSLLGEKIELAVKHDLVAYQTTLPYAGAEYVKECILDNKSIVPASVYVGMMIAAMEKAKNEIIGEVSLRLIDANLHRVLELGSKPIKLQTVVHKLADVPNWRVEVLAWDEETHSWNSCADATIARYHDVEKLPSIRFRKGNMCKVDIKQYYLESGKFGAKYLPAFHNIESLEYIDNVGRASVSFMGADSGEPHPLLLESLYQIVSAIGMQNLNPENILVPQGFRSYHAFGKFSTKLYIEFRLHRSKSDNEQSADFLIYSSDRRLLAVVSKLAVRETKATYVKYLERAESVSEELPNIEEAMAKSEQDFALEIISGVKILLGKILRLNVDQEFSDNDAFLNKSFTSLGMDSILAQELSKQGSDWLNMDIPIEMIIGGYDIRDFIDFVQEGLLLSAIKSQSSDLVADEGQEQIEVLVI